MAENKRFLDFQGLQSFWNLIKKYYEDAEAKALSAVQAVEVKDVPGIVSVSEGKAVIDLSDFARKEDVSKIFRFMGTVATKTELEAKAPSEGDVYHVADTKAEYVFIKDSDSSEGRWEELGSVFSADLSDYYDKEYIDANYRTAEEVDKVAADLIKGVEDNKAAIETEVVERKEAFDSIIDIADCKIGSMFEGVDGAPQHTFVDHICTKCGTLEGSYTATIDGQAVETVTSEAVAGKTVALTESLTPDSPIELDGTTLTAYTGDGELRKPLEVNAVVKSGDVSLKGFSIKSVTTDSAFAGMLSIEKGTLVTGETKTLTAKAMAMSGGEVSGLSEASPAVLTVKADEVDLSGVKVSDARIILETRQ